MNEAGWSGAIGFVAGALGVIAITPLVILFSQKIGALSTIDFRRRDRNRKALLGGIGIIFVANLVMSLGQRQSLPWTFLLPAVLIGIFGAYDDLRGMGSRQKLLWQVGVAGLWLFLSDPQQLILYQLGISQPAAMAISLFWIVGMMNAVNMIDGMDGLASGFGLIASLSMLSFSGMHGDFSLFVVAGCCLGFLLWNFQPAKIFLGDSGAQFIGFYLATQATTATLVYPSFRSLLLPMLVLALPQMDAVLAMFRRFRLRSSMVKADHDHLHHKLQKMGLNVKQTWVVMMGVSVYAGLSATVLREMLDSHRFWMVFGLCLLAMVNLLSGVLFMEWKLAHQASEWSGTLLQRHLPGNLARVFAHDKTRFGAAVLYDLFPYYKELQNRGISDLHQFVEAFASYLRRQHPGAQLVSIGAYSLAALCEKGQVERNHTIEEFSKLLKAHRLQTTEEKIPWGLHFFLSDKETSEFQVRFHFVFEQRASDNKGVAA